MNMRTRVIPAMMVLVFSGQAVAADISLINENRGSGTINGSELNSDHTNINRNFININTELSRKADQTAVDAKADKNYVETKLNDKANTTYVDNKVNNLETTKANQSALDDTNKEVQKLKTDSATHQEVAQAVDAKYTETVAKAADAASSAAKADSRAADAAQRARDSASYAEESKRSSTAAIAAAKEAGNRADAVNAKADSAIHTAELADGKANTAIETANRAEGKIDGALKESKAYTDSRFKEFDNKLGEVKKFAAAGTAAALAASQIPQVSQGSAFSLGVGLGSYSGESALALGISARLGDYTVTKLSVTSDTSNNIGMGGGIAVEW